MIDGLRSRMSNAVPLSTAGGAVELGALKSGHELTVGVAGFTLLNRVTTS